MHHKTMFAVLISLSVGCAAAEFGEGAPSPDPQAVIDKSGLGPAKGVVGDVCTSGCIWSGYAVNLGVQSPTHACGAVPCVCVKRGDVYSECAPDVGLLDDADGADSSEVVAGAACGSSCIWSILAVSLGAQSGTHRCQGRSCACVADGDIWTGCGDGEIAGPDPVAPAPDSRPQSADVPYFYQYDNRLAPGATCQNTSVAMLLADHGWRGVPDDITAEFGRRRAQSPAGLADVFNTLARRSGLPVRATPRTNGTFAGLRAELAAGRPVIVHGYFTRAGHVVVVTGEDASGYFVNDPAGRWSETFRGGYPYADGFHAGKNVHYGRAAFEAAVGTSNGRDYLPLWYHAIR
jgi:hypothetical protein